MDTFDHPLEVRLMRSLGLPFLLLIEEVTLVDRYRWVRDHLLGGPLRTLDAGCGLGLMVLAAAQRDREVVGISYDDRENRHAAYRAELMGIHNVRFVTGDLRKLDAMELGSYDQVICAETIEHILDDEKLVRDLAQRLKVGGRLLLTTPFKGAYEGEKLSEQEDGGHVRPGYTREELQRLFARNGLRLLSCDFISGRASRAVQRVRQRLSDRLNPSAAAYATAPLKVLCILDPLLTRARGRPYLSIAVIAQRT